MAGDFGALFSPTDENQQRNSQTGSLTPIADAIQVLNLRVPSFSGGIAPRALLTGPGAGAFPNAGGMPGGLEALLRRLFGQGAGGPAATPNVIPGANKPSGPSIGSNPEFPRPGQPIPQPPHGPWVPNPGPLMPAPPEPPSMSNTGPMVPPAVPRKPFRRDTLG